MKKILSIIGITLLIVGCSTTHKNAGVNGVASGSAGKGVQTQGLGSEGQKDDILSGFFSKGLDLF